MLIRFWYHVKYPKSELYPHLLSHVLAVGYMENTGKQTWCLFPLSCLRLMFRSADHLRIVLTVWEAILDGSLLIVFAAATFCCRSYVEEKRTPDIVGPETPAQQRLKKD